LNEKNEPCPLKVKKILFMISIIQAEKERMKEKNINYSSEKIPRFSINCL